MTDTQELHSLSYEELKEQCRILGIAIKGNAESLREKLRAALDGDPAEDAVEAPVEAPAKVDRKKDWITIQIAEKEGDNQPVFVGHNGKAYFIRRGEPVQVPKHVVSVLKDAMQMHRTNDGEWKRVPSYPFQILS